MCFHVDRGSRRGELGGVVEKVVEGLDELGPVRLEDEALGDGGVDRTVEAQAGDTVFDQRRQVEGRDVGRGQARLYFAELAEVVDDLAHQVRLLDEALRKPASVLRL